MDGTEFPLERSVSRTEVGGRCFYTAIVRDITERKRAEVLLRQSVERFRIVAESMPLVIFTAQPNGAVDYFNQHWAEFTGLPTGSIENLNWAQFVHPGDLEETDRQWRHSVETGAPFQLEHRFRRSDGDSRWHLSRANALRDAGGNVLIWTGASTDIDDQKSFENELKAADTRKDAFLAMLAHELRNPLAALNCGLALIAIAGAGDEADRGWAVKMAGHQVELLSRMVDDLLDTSRITRGTFQLRKERVQPSELIGRAVDTIRHLAEAQRHKLHVTAAPNLPELEADPARLEQVICNLLTNAVKFTPKGGRIELSVGTEGAELVLRVRDTGDGIAPDFLPHVFDSFAQADTSLVRERGGLGIGLTLVKAIVELHGGSVEARSDGLDRGTEMVIRLPTVGADKAVIPDPRSLKGRSIRGEDRLPDRRRILIVEDSLEYALGLRRLLETAGHDVHICNDGLGALSEAPAFGPDVILLDLGLPGMDGYEVAWRMRENEALAHSSIVVVSGYASEEDRRRSREVGVDEHLVKPVRFSELLRVVELNRLAVG
jgi:two-component system CheB/CheR fusion protein